VGTPRALYEAPANLFVADFLGDSNLLTATIARVSGDELAVELGNGEKIRAARGTSAAAQGSRTVVLIRPEDISVTSTDQRTAGQDVVAGTIKDISYHGDTFKLDVALGADMLKVKVPRERGAGMERGQKVFLTWNSSVVRLLPAADRTSDASGEDER
jgi:ABC-type Fe3+/spermidine/putrescine transport system ATPase subunit